MQKKQNIIYYVATMLANSNNILFPGHNRLPITSIGAGAQAIINVLGHQYSWLAGGYDLEIWHF